MSSNNGNINGSKPFTNKRGKGITPHVNIHAKVSIDQYKWLKEEASRRGAQKGVRGNQFMCEIIRDAIDLYKQYVEFDNSPIGTQALNNIEIVNG